MTEEQIKRLEEVIEITGMSYESGKMLRTDSEVEIDLAERGRQGYILSVADYSESRGSAETVALITTIDDDNERAQIIPLIEDICARHNWAYCL